MFSFGFSFLKNKSFIYYKFNLKSPENLYFFAEFKIDYASRFTQ